MARRNRTAKYIATLVYVDEPQLVLFESRRAMVIAVSVPDDTKEYPFLAALVSLRDWERYEREMVDLLFLFRYARKDNLYTFDLARLRAQSISMQPIDLADVPDDWFPERRFFARDHTEQLDQPISYQVGEERFSIDGEWGLPDFAQFYSKYSDLYAFEISVEKYADPKVAPNRRSSIANAFLNYPFRGGSSYGHFYNDLAGALPLAEQPGVEGVQYNSPGYVALRGRGDVFGRIRAAIENFEANYVAIKQQYNHLHGHLAKLGFLATSPREFRNSSPTAAAIMLEAEQLAASLLLDRIDVLRSLCAGNALVFAKVVLSYSRRIEGAFSFIAEGRASLPR